MFDKKIVLTKLRYAKNRRAPRIYVHHWKGHQEANVRFLKEIGWTLKSIAFTLAIPLEAIKYVLYKKKPGRQHKPKIVRRYMPKEWL